MQLFIYMTTAIMLSAVILVIIILFQEFNYSPHKHAGEFQQEPHALTIDDHTFFLWQSLTKEYHRAGYRYRDGQLHGRTDGRADRYRDQADRQTLEDRQTDRQIFTLDRQTRQTGR